MLQTPWLPTVLPRDLVGGYTEWIIRLSWSSCEHRQSDQPTLCITECERRSSPEWRGRGFFLIFGEIKQTPPIFLKAERNREKKQKMNYQKRQKKRKTEAKKNNK